jgi:anti-sigma factor RsiW
MRCSWVQDRLVAFADDELSPGETVFVAEHLETCEVCASMDARLRAASPRPALVVPAGVLDAMAAQIDAAIDDELSSPAQAPEPSGLAALPGVARAGRWLRRDREMSNGAMLGWGLLFAACFGWGLSNWLAVPADPTATTPTFTAAPTPSDEIDSQQYRPASYAIDGEDDDWR